MTDNNSPHFVSSKKFHGDNGYIEWLREIKSRYQTVRSRVALQANYGALEFNWLLGRDIVQKKAEARWGTGVVNQLSLDMVEQELREYKERDKKNRDEEQTEKFKAEE